jgi:hypothetical protein
VATFDIRDVRKLEENYENCVKAIRDAMESSTDVRFTFSVARKDVSVPVAPGKDYTSRGAYSIEITDGQKTLSLVGTKYQTWFRGIVTNKGLRYEIDEMTPKVMKGSKSLHTDGQYPHLITGGVAVLKLGYQQLLRAFHSLATLGDAGNEQIRSEHKEAIAVMVVMLFEGPRFPAVCKFVKGLLRQKRDDLVGKERGILINNWCDISKEFYEAVNGNGEKITISHESLQAVKDAADGLRIMCRSMWDKWLDKQRGAAGGSSSKSKK